MKIKTRIKILALLLLTSPTRALNASSLQGMTAGILPADPPMVLFGKFLINVLNIALIPLALLTILFYFLFKRQKPQKGKKNKFKSIFIFFMIVLVLAVLVRIFLPFLLDFYKDNFLY